MPVPHVQFTIRTLMIAAAIIAGLLALPDEWRVVAAALALPCLALVAARRLLLRGRRQLAGACFWVLAIGVNILFAVSCIAPEGYLLGLLVLVWLSTLLPTLAGFGATWATLATRDVAAARRSPSRIWLSVIALTVMPAATAWTVWPLRVAFLAARPALDRLADRVAAGRAPASPRWAGPFQVLRSAVDPATGNVGLMIDPNPNGPTGFVRHGRRGTGPSDCFAPFRGDVLHVELADGWCYHEED